MSSSRAAHRLTGHLAQNWLPGSLDMYWFKEFYPRTDRIAIPWTIMFRAESRAFLRKRDILVVSLLSLLDHPSQIWTALF